MSQQLSRADLATIRLALHLGRNNAQIPDHFDKHEVIAACKEAQHLVERTLECGDYVARTQGDAQTITWLFDRYKQPIVPVKDCVDIFHVTVDTALKRIRKGRWPVPTFKMVDSPNNPIAMNLFDIAAYIDQKRDQMEQRRQPASDELPLEIIE
jgi:hypothetical protein